LAALASVAAALRSGQPRTIVLRYWLDLRFCDIFS